MRNPSSSSGTEVEIESRETGGAPMPTSATWARFHMPVTRRNSGSSDRLALIAADGAAVVYLASDEATMVNGAELRVDGGFPVR